MGIKTTCIRGGKGSVYPRLVEHNSTKDIWLLVGERNAVLMQEGNGNSIISVGGLSTYVLEGLCSPFYGTVTLENK